MTNFASPGSSFATPPVRNSDGFAPPPRRNVQPANDLRAPRGARFAEFRPTRKKKNFPRGEIQTGQNSRERCDPCHAIGSPSLASLRLGGSTCPNSRATHRPYAFRRPQGLTFVQLAQPASPDLQQFGSYIHAGLTVATNKPRRFAMPGFLPPIPTSLAYLSDFLTIALRR